MKRWNRFITGIISISSMMLVWLAWTQQAAAESSFKATMSFFQGFDLEEGVIDQGVKKLLEEGTSDPNTIRLVFVIKDVQPEKVAYSFNTGTDFQIGYADGTNFFAIVPTDLTAFAVIPNKTFESIEQPNLSTLDFRYDPLEIQFDDPNYSIIALTQDDHFFKIGNFRYSGSTVVFDYQKVEPDVTVTPEPSTMLLFGIGLLCSLFAIRKRKITKTLIIVAMCANCLLFMQERGMAADGFDFPTYHQGEGVTWVYTNPYPAPPENMNDCFGVKNKNLMHAGVDWPLSTTDEIRAVSDGIVKFAGDKNYPGWVIIIEHADPVAGTVYSMYGHVTNVKVSSGTQVTKGQIIANAVYQLTKDGLDNTHLHFEMRKFYTPVPNGCVSPAGPGYTYPHPDTFGYMNPVQFINEHRKKVCETEKVEDRKIPLGGVDVDKYCQRRGYDKAHLVGNRDAGSWQCTKDASWWAWTPYNYSSSSGMDLNLACRERYGSGAWAETDPNKGGWASKTSWTCYRELTYPSWDSQLNQYTYKKELGGLDLNAFCRKERWTWNLGVNGQWLWTPTKYSDAYAPANGNAGSWSCVGKSTFELYSNTRSSGIDMVQACHEQKSSPNSYAEATPWSDPYSWRCYANQPIYETKCQFKPILLSQSEFSVNVAKAGTGNGSVIAKDINCGVDCTGGKYDIGSFVDLKAIPDLNSKFAGWQINGKAASGAITVSSDPVMMTATFMKTSTKPVITGVSPNILPRKPDWSKQWITIYGENFAPGAKLFFKIPGFDYPDRVPEFISSNELRYYISVGPTQYDWTVEVINPDGQVSNAYGFQVR